MDDTEKLYTKHLHSLIVKYTPTIYSRLSHRKTGTSKRTAFTVIIKHPIGIFLAVKYKSE
mgnify:FL=1